MFNDVVEFLNEAKESPRQFENLLEFYKFKDRISHKQNFEDVAKDVGLFFEEQFSTTAMTITTYDIETTNEITLFNYGKEMSSLDDTNIISYDFSKSYSLNGRVKFLIEEREKLQEVHSNKNYLNYIFYEIKQILVNFLAIKKIQENSFVDEVTTLPNRRFLVNFLRTQFAVAKKENFKIALLKIDVDRFKAVLEEFNYEIGNQVLKKVAKVLEDNLVSTDIVTKFQGNTFLVCMQDIYQDEQVISYAEKVINQFAQEFVVVNPKTSQKLFKTISVGIVLYPDDGESFDDLFRNCDIALDEAKNKGRSSYQFYENDQNSSIDLF